MESVKKEVFGDTEVLIMPIEDDKELSYEADDEDPLAYTSTHSKAADKMACVIRAITDGLSEELNNLKATLRPSKVEIDLTIGFSEQSNAWVIGVKGEQKASLKITWNCETRRGSDGGGARA